MAEIFRHHEMELLGLHEALAAFFAQFEADGRDAYSSLLYALDDAGVSPTFATLNYDCILETALERQGRPVDYFADRVPARSRRVLKLHGSCNFFARGFKIARTAIRNRISGSRADMEVVRLKDVPARCRGETVGIPVMAHYAAGKPIDLGNELVWNQAARWARFAGAATAIVIVGVRYNADDQHVWAPVMGSAAAIGFVGSTSDCELLQSQHPNVTHIGPRFQGAIAEIVQCLRQ